MADGPSIDVAIGAKIDSLNSGLKAAEQKVAQSAQIIGKAGETAGSAFSGGFIAKIATLGAIAMTLKQAVRGAVDSAKAGESGVEIGTALFRGAVEGAKQIPIAGALVELLDYAIDGAEEAAAERAGALGRRIAEELGSAAEAQSARIAAAESLSEMLKDQLASESPTAMVERAAEKKTQAAQRTHQAALKAMEIEHAKDMELARGDEAMEASALREKSRAELKAKQDLATLVKRIDVERFRTLQNMTVESNEAIRKEDNDAEEKAKARSIAAAKKAIDTALDVAKNESEIALRAREESKDAMEERLEVLKRATEPSREQRLGELIDKAADPLVRSGQTALGEFKFADGSGGEAIRIAELQLSKLEAVEALQQEIAAHQKETAQLQREMRDYQKQIASGIAA